MEKIEVPNSELDDMILIKSDGYPDNLKCQISHVCHLQKYNRLGHFCSGLCALPADHKRRA